MKFNKHIIFLLVTVAFVSGMQAQSIVSADRKKLAAKEDSLINFAKQLILDTLTEERMHSDQTFTRTLIRALQIKNSFYYPFDSVQGISKIYAPDSSFRIFSWNMQFNDYYSRQRGAIQMKTKDGSLKLIPLRDVSEFTTGAADSVRTKDNWIGAVYYNIIEKNFGGKKFYTLFGIDYNTAQSNKKWIEVMYFNEKNEPVFGGNFFKYIKSDSAFKYQTPYRFNLEFKKDARVLVNYIPDLDVILVDHLVSESDEPENKWTLVPDGDNEAFKWEQGKWVHIDKAFDYKVDMNGVDPAMGNPPMGDPLLDANGNHNNKKLDEKNKKNQSKEKPVIPIKDEQ